MEPIKSTIEILAFKALNRNINQVWVQWAVDMLVKGYDSDYLAVLANESEPFEQIRLQEITTKILNELCLDYSDKDIAVKNYANYLIERALNKEITNATVLSILKDIYLELGCVNYIQDFYLLYCANKDLFYDSHQYYWPDTNRENINDVITAYFISWKEAYLRNRIIFAD